MAITFRHDAAAGLIGSFAAGQAAGRRRSQKYVFDVLQRRQDQRFQLQRDVLRRQEARDLLGQRGRQAGELLQQRGEQDIAIQGLQTQRARELLLGRGLQQQGLLEQAGQQRLELEDVRGEFDIDQEILEGLRRRQLVLPPEAEAEMRQLDAARLAGLGEDEPEARNRIATRRRELLRMAHPVDVGDLTPIERARQNTVLWDPDKQDYVSRQEAGPRAFPVPLDERGFPDLRDALTPDPAAEQKQRAAQFKARDNLITAQEALEAAGTGDEELSPRQSDLLQQRVDLRQEELDALTGGQAADPGAALSPLDPFAPETPIPQPVTGPAPLAPATDPFAPEAPIPEPITGQAPAAQPGPVEVAAPVEPEAAVAADIEPSAPPVPTPRQIRSAREHRPGRRYRHGQVFKRHGATYQYNANTGRAVLVEVDELPPRPLQEQVPRRLPFGSAGVAG